MAKKTIRIASIGKAEHLVDLGAEIDVELKRLASQDKTIKQELGGAAVEVLQPEESSVKLAGTKSLALISTVEKYNINTNSDSFPEVQNGIDLNIFDKVVKTTKSLVIPPEIVEKACELLRQAGLQVMIQTTHTIDAEEYRELVSNPNPSPEKQKFIDALRKSVECKSTMRVTYESK